MDTVCGTPTEFCRANSCRMLSTAVRFFDLPQMIYTFFTASTHRFEILTEALKFADCKVNVTKVVSSTRWSCRTDASKAFVQGYVHILDVLKKITDDPDVMEEARCKASGLY